MTGTKHGGGTGVQFSLVALLTWEALGWTPKGRSTFPSSSFTLDLDREWRGSVKE